MHLTRISLSATGLAGLASSTALPERRQESALQPWEVSLVSTHTPSGRPGNSPYSTLSIIIADPNVAPPSEASCYVEWLSPDTPYGVVYDCVSADTEGKWRFETMPPTEDDTWGQPTTNFLVQFMRVQEDEDGAMMQYEGTAYFKVGDNMEGSCGGSGVCNWLLKEKSSPVLVGQMLIAS